MNISTQETLQLLYFCGSALFTILLYLQGNRVEKLIEQNKSIKRQKHIRTFLFSVSVIFMGLLFKQGNRVDKLIEDDNHLQIAKSKDSAAKAYLVAEVAKDSAAKANERARKLENANLTLEREVVKAQTKLLATEDKAIFAAGRSVLLIPDEKAILKELKNKPKLRVEILYKPEDEYSYLLAGQLDRILGERGAGWKIEVVRSLTEQDAIEPKTDMPLTIRSGGYSSVGVTVISNGSYLNSSDFANNSVFCLQTTMVRHLMPPTRKGVTSSASSGIAFDRRMPDDLVRIIVAPRVELGNPGFPLK